ncbi:MAG: polyisoprenyl-teichoic acid--peptidoglycan teichoic acid transferase [Actinomycetota bacterium]|jgi:LCP family protein required for cell wall assembly|nr:polyisoprenyl-teichoic acid--peptidoglycan teichoic acid transferase [Actinomycetota bacterium]
MKRASILVSFVLALALLAALLPIMGRVPRSEAAITIGRVHAGYQPTTGKLFILVIGNDARQGNPNGALADAIHLVGIDTRSMKAGILNFPRDSWVSIPGHGTNKINASLIDGGPELVAKTVESLTGIRIAYWVMTGFGGFYGIVKRLGGVKVRVPRNLNDPSGSGAVMSAGVHKLAPLQALSFVRDRHDFPNGDVSRTANQATFLLALLKKLRKEVTNNPASLLKWMAIARRYTRLDISLGELFRLGIVASELSPKDVGNKTLPVSFGFEGAQSVVFISPQASSIYASFKKKAHF